MNTQMERLFHSIRRGIEDNVKLAFRTMECTRSRDFEELKRRLDEIKKELKHVEALKPYFAAAEAFAAARKGKRASVRAKSRKPDRRRRKKI